MMRGEIMIRLLLEEGEGGGVRLVAISELGGWRFPGWFERLLNTDRVQELAKFNEKMYRVYDRVEREMEFGKIYRNMICDAGHQHPELPQLYCSIMNAIHPELSEEEIYQVVVRVKDLWLQASVKNRCLWECLTGQRKERPQFIPQAAASYIGFKKDLLPRYATDELQQLASEALNELTKNEFDESREEKLKKNYVKLPIILNELSRARGADLNRQDVIRAFKNILGENNQTSTSTEVASAQHTNAGLNDLIIDNPQLIRKIKSNRLEQDFTADEKAVLNQFHEKLFKAVPECQILFAYGKSNQVELTEEVIQNYNSLKNKLKGYIVDSRFDEMMKNNKVHALMKFLIRLLLVVEKNAEQKVESDKNQTGADGTVVGNVKRALNAFDKLSEPLKSDLSSVQPQSKDPQLIAKLGGYSIHKRPHEIEEYIKGENLLNSQNLQHRNIKFEVLFGEEHFAPFFEDILILNHLEEQIKKKVETSDWEKSDRYNRLIELVKENYRHYENLLVKARDGYFLKRRFVGMTGDNNINRFIYQLLYKFEEIMLTMYGMKQQPENQQSVDAAAVSIEPHAEKKFENSSLNLTHDDIKLKGVISRNNEVMLAKDRQNIDIEELNKFKELLKQHTDFVILNNAVKEFKLANNNQKKLLQILDRSVSSYLSMLNKLRKNVFNEKPYTNDVKIYAYHLVYQWEKFALNIDFEDYLSDKKEAVISEQNKRAEFKQKLPGYDIETLNSALQSQIESLAEKYYDTSINYLNKKRFNIEDEEFADQRKFFDIISNIAQSDIPTEIQSSISDNISIKNFFNIENCYIAINTQQKMVYNFKEEKGIDYEFYLNLKKYLSILEELINNHSVWPKAFNDILHKIDKKNYEKEIEKYKQGGELIKKFIMNTRKRYNI